MPARRLAAPPDPLPIPSDHGTMPAHSLAQFHTAELHERSSRQFSHWSTRWSDDSLLAALSRQRVVHVDTLYALSMQSL